MRLSLVRQLIMDEPLMITAGKLETILSIVSEREGLDVSCDSMVGLGDSTKLETAGGKVAIIPVTGSLTHRPTGLSAMSGLTTYEGIDQQLEQIMSDDSISEGVLDLNTPGGMVSGLFDLADRIHMASKIKTITAIVNESAYSAGYLIAAACSEIILTRTSGVGSIGVITAHTDRSGENERAGRKVTYITAGDKKAYGNPDEPLSDEALSDVQARVNKSYELFVATVAQYRGIDAEAVRNTQAGMFTGTEALDVGLADRVMPAKDALQMIIDRNTPSQPKKAKRINRRARAIKIST